eukprot:COSAG03_NODE_1607_length_3790_cov_5.544839_3_plen_271_part_00
MGEGKVRLPHRVLHLNSLCSGSSVTARALSVSRALSDCLSLPLCRSLPLCLSLGCDQAVELRRMPRGAAVLRKAVWLRLRLRSFLRLRQSDGHSQSDTRARARARTHTESWRRTVGLAALNSARAVACALGSSSRTGTACGVLHTWRDRRVTRASERAREEGGGRGRASGRQREAETERVRTVPGGAKGLLCTRGSGEGAAAPSRNGFISSQRVSERERERLGEREGEVGRNSNHMLQPPPARAPSSGRPRRAAAPPFSFPCHLPMFQYD